MKNSKLLLALSLFLFTNWSTAQQRVALQSGGVTTIFSSTNPFIAAYAASTTGDTIYLSGGAFSSPSTLDKGITIFGAGFHQDSTTATYPTLISNDIALGANADNLYMEGIQFQNVTRLSADSTNNVSFVRCRLNSFNSSYNSPGESVGWAFIQNVIGSMYLNGIISSTISNNIITDQLYYSSSNLFSNNLIKRQGTGSTGSHTMGHLNNNVFVNNVFHNTYIYYIYGSSVGNIWENNVYAYLTPNQGGAFIANNNYYGIDLTTVFVNQTGNAFDYSHDYHLLPAALALYIGNDSTQVGIYGGNFPFKEGAVPQNPHISSKNIAPQTAPNGDLNIQIQVKAQN